NGGLPISSGGNVGTGSASTRLLAGRPTFTYTFANSFLWGGSVTINGTLREVNTGTFASEARIRAISPSNGESTGVDIQPFTSTGFTSTVTATNVNRLIGGFTGTPFNVGGQTWTFSMYESFNDSGEDAQWDGLSIRFDPYVPPTPPACINLGTWNATQIDTLNSGTVNPGTDTEIALYDSNGILLGSNDDHGTAATSFNFNSLLGGLSLTNNAVYYVAVGGFNSVFANGFSAVGGTALGDYRLNINGVQGVANGTLAAASMNWYCFTVPTPSALALLGLGGVVAGRRRR
ncbi:MAG: PEP-CTERM sorting domain-containing protein, partial [Phycisphaerales bacterium]